jgi:multimeric flavodoxin WrbA
MASSIDPRKGQAPPMLDRDAFGSKFRGSFFDPAFAAEHAAIERLETIAWHAYDKGNKAPRTAKAGAGFHDPEYALSDEWRATRDRLRAAQARQQNPATPSRVLLVCASPRNDGSCPGEISKSHRLVGIAEQPLREAQIEVDRLDLSRLTSEAHLHIHPCKGCVSTAMPLCHWPCSCYPNHALGQVNDWMAEIYERWTAAHGALIVTPVHWYQAPSVLKLMMDRLVCADGGNPDPTSTHGKNVEQAKALERAGWSYPKHLAGRTYGLVVHGDVAGTESVRRALSDWLDWMGLIDAGALARIDRFIGYYEPYADSHAALDRDRGVQDEVRNVARALARAVAMQRAGQLASPDARLGRPRPK